MRFLITTLSLLVLAAVPISADDESGTGPGNEEPAKGPAPHTIPWSTMDGGSDVADSSSFVLNGTIGQPDAEGSVSPSYRLEGGFWPSSRDSGSSEIFSNGFESGDTTAWSTTVGGP